MTSEQVGVNPLPPWRPLLRGARQREGRAAGAGWLQLATVASDGSPRVRTLVFRGWSQAGDLELLTDARSDKTAELLYQPMVELCWLFRKAREQFRLRGSAGVITSEKDPVALADHWQKLAPSGRSVWAWPDPGKAFSEPGPWPCEVHDGEAVPQHLLLVRIHLTQVEQLDLKPHPHLRRCWEREHNWRERRLNP